MEELQHQPDTLGRFTKSDTNIEHYDGCPAFVEMSGSGFTRPLYDGLLPSYRLSASFFRHKQGDYLTLISDQQRIGREVIDGFIKDSTILLGTYSRWLKNFEELLSKFPVSFKEDLGTLTDQELLAWADTFVRYYRDTVGMPSFIDGYMFYADGRLDTLLRTFCEKDPALNYTKLFSILSAPTEPSFINEEEQALQGLKKDSPQEELEDHVLKYAWIKSSYAGYVPYTQDMLEAELSNAGAVHDSGGQLRANAEQKQALIAQYGFTEEIRAIARLTEIVVKWQDQRKNYTMTFITLKQKIVDEVGRRAGIPAQCVAYAETAEMAAVLDGRVPRQTLEERERGCVFVYENGQTTHILAGPEAIEFFAKLSAVDTGGIAEIRGMVASLGTATGPARIIMTAQDIREVEDGDILIAPMTRPEHLLGMKKAAAIVTDDGGITCHAAIVSRELRKPCIIGTKIATKVFKTGDMVEVDAERGVVRKI